MNTFLSTTIELWPVEKLTAYDRNARTPSDEQIGQIARSIQEFGFTNPILVDTRAGILAGHARLRGARQASRVRLRGPPAWIHFSRRRC
jgi:ParB-like chromosome segregation protein Spo0J